MVQFYKVKKKYVLRAGIIMAITLIVISLVINGLRINDYDITISKIRNEKDVYFKESEGSPITEKEKFRGLDYFAITPKYKVIGKLSIVDTLSVLKVLRNDGKLTQYKRFARVSFLLDNIEHSVVLLKQLDQSEGDASLFMPFTDLSNGKETYQTGRYIDLHYKDGQKTIEVDFNLAYNPYCAYNYKYSCPIPPRENFIQANILAGEKNFLQKE
jgi:uncharacterized protein (DUF1684 family)